MYAMQNFKDQTLLKKETSPWRYAWPPTNPYKIAKFDTIFTPNYIYSFRLKYLLKNFVRHYTSHEKEIRFFKAIVPGN